MTNKRILVVDDQEDLRGVLRDLLTGSGYVVLEATDGQAAIAMARAEHPMSSSWTSRCQCLTATRPPGRSRPIRPWQRHRTLR